MIDKLLISAGLTLLLSGSAHTFLLKLQDLSGFRYPYFQCATIFLGELLCLLIYAILYKCFGKVRESFKSNYESVPIQYELLTENQTPDETFSRRFGFYIFAIPAAIDGISTILSNLGLMLATASVYQMLRQGHFISDFVVHAAILRRRIFKHQVLGVGMVAIGVFLISLGTILEHVALDPPLGIWLLLGGQVVAGGLHYFDEKYIRKIMINPLLAVGIEGLSGFGYYIVVLPLLYWIPCYNPKLCSYAHIEDSSDAIDKIATQGDMFLMWIGTLFAILVSSCSALVISEKFSPVHRGSLELSRTLVVWVLSLSFGWEKFVWLQLLGYLFLLPGVLIYTEALVVPVLGLNESAEESKEYMQKVRDVKRHRIGNETSFVFG